MRIDDGNIVQYLKCLQSCGRCERFEFTLLLTATLCTVDKKDARLTRRMIVMDEVKGTLCTVDKILQCLVALLILAVP